MKRGDRKMKTVFSYLKPYLGRMGIGFTVKVAGTLSEPLRRARLSLYPSAALRSLCSIQENSQAR